ncbi:MAG: hypothetical protein K2K94_04930, partial [Muribaculaceae bacterium]|nr:hypothetical protein [Muribaculaceae bacterium]
KIYISYIYDKYLVRLIFDRYAATVVFANEATTSCARLRRACMWLQVFCGYAALDASVLNTAIINELIKRRSRYRCRAAPE